MSTTQKHTSTKSLLLAFVLVLGMIVSPVLALGYQITAEPLGGVLTLVPGKVSNLSIDVSQKGDAIQRLTIDIPTNTVLNFTLWYGNGTTVSGWMAYRNSTDCVDWYPYTNFCQYSGVSIGGDDKGYSYRGYQEAGRVNIVGYARNWTSDTGYTTGFMVYDALRFSTKDMSYYPVSSISDNVIYKFNLTSTKPVAVAYYTNTRENVAKAVATTLLEAINEWVQLAISLAFFVKDTAIALFFWLKFFFWDNLGMTVALYISISMAYAANTSKDIFRFIGKFFNDQKKLFEFVLSLWTTLVNIIATFRGIFRI